MYQVRRLPFNKSHLLRSARTTPAAQTQGVINENNKRLKAYNLLVNSRKLWEQSENPVNKGAFKVVPATRDVPEKIKREVPIKFSNFEAPEQALTKKEEEHLKAWKYSYLNNRDLPEFGADKAWSTPEELLPGREDVLDFEENNETDNVKLQEEEEGEDDYEVIREKQREYNIARQKSKYARKIMSGEIYKQPSDDPEDLIFQDREERLHQMEATEGAYKPTYVPGNQVQEDFIRKMHEKELEDTVSEELEAKPEGEVEDEEGANIGDEDEGEDLTATNKKRRCLMCGYKAPKAHPMNVYLLARFVSPHGDIFPRTVTGLCMRHQRDTGRMFRSMKGSGLLNFKKGFTIHIPFEPPLHDDGIDKEQEAINKHLVAMGFNNKYAVPTSPDEVPRVARTEGEETVEEREPVRVAPQRIVQEREEEAETEEEEEIEMDDYDYQVNPYAEEYEPEFADEAPRDLNTVVHGSRHNIPHKKAYMGPRRTSSTSEDSGSPLDAKPYSSSSSSRQEWRKKRPDKGVVPMNQRSKRGGVDDRRSGNTPISHD